MLIVHMQLIWKEILARTSRRAHRIILQRKTSRQLHEIRFVSRIARSLSISCSTTPTRKEVTTVPNSIPAPVQATDPIKVLPRPF